MVGLALVWPGWYGQADGEPGTGLARLLVWSLTLVWSQARELPGQSTSQVDIKWTANQRSTTWVINHSWSHRQPRSSVIGQQGSHVQHPPLLLLLREPDAAFDSQPACAHSPRSHARSLSSDPQVTPEADGDNYPSLPVIVTNEPEEARETDAPGVGGGGVGASGGGGTGAPEPAEVPVADLIKSLVHFLANRPSHMPLWQYEDITAKGKPTLSAVFRFIGVAMTGRMVSDILSRLVETVAEQGEDMQGYVTELLLTLEAAVDSLESNFRPLDYMRDIFKSTPNLNNKDGGPQPNGNAFAAGKRSPGVCVGCVGSHTRSTSYSVTYCMRKNPPAAPDKHQHDRTRPCSEAAKGACSNLCRSRSAQSLKLLGDSATQDDKLTILATLFWVGASLLESDYEHEFLLGVRLLARVMARLPLDRPDARERLDRTQAHCAPSLHALLLKGCTHPNTYEPVVGVLADMIPLLELPVIDPTQSLAFPMTVVALLPYMLLHYEDANELCVRAACHIAQFTAEKSKKLENLGTVMTLYSRRTFSKESFQWTKCVVKYLWDTYSHLSMQMLAFLVEVLEKGAANLQLPVLSVLHCMLYYVELSAPAAQPVTADLLRAVVKFLDSCAQDGCTYKEAMKILKLVVTRCSTLVVPPFAHTHAAAAHLDSHKKELPGRTMEFTFDLSQTPVIGRKYLPKAGSQPATGPSSLSSAATATPDKGSSASASGSGSGSASTVVCAEAAPAASAASPRRSLSLSPADALQSRVRECLVNLLTTCGQRVGLPKSPSVIFSQSSELLERESSMASSLEEVSGTPGNEPSAAAPPTDHFGVFKDFDFLEYESESIEGESSDNFNWGVRRRLLSEERDEGAAPERSPPQRPRPPDHAHTTKSTHEDSSDEEGGWEEGAAGRGEGDASAHELALRPRTHSFSSASSGEPDGDRGDVTPVPGAGPALRDAWRASVTAHWRHATHVPPMALVHRLHTVLKLAKGLFRD
ncbi:protein furry-like [Ostrinia furnacalis]|uniref:protein furry-like n=1 Tax=Ostrinia furnacalis TaxID=93504 RepID=UPI001039F9B0|nr:protein furry-like [Ostrinia furnacalis]